jgi:hypothetical protein
MVFVGHFAGIALAQIIYGVETIATLKAAASCVTRAAANRAGFASGTPTPPPREAAEQELLPTCLGRHVGELLVLQVQLLGLEDSLHRRNIVILRVAGRKPIYSISVSNIF